MSQDHLVSTSFMGLVENLSLQMNQKHGLFLVLNLSKPWDLLHMNHDFILFWTWSQYGLYSDPSGTEFGLNVF